MDSRELKERTRAFGLRVVKLAMSLPRNRAGDVFARQMMRCGTSVAANYRSACRARSRADFVAKLGLVEEEADETMFWIEFCVDTALAKESMVADLLSEADEIVSIIVASRKTARAANKPARNRQSAIGNRKS